MDRTSACIIALRVSDYVEIRDDGRHLTHRTRNFELVVDRDTTNFKDLSDDIEVDAWEKSGNESEFLEQGNICLFYSNF